MRVLEVISSLKPVGGGETFAVNFSRCMNDIAEFKAVILYKEYNQMFIDRLNEKNIDYVILDKKKHFDLKNAKELRKIIEEFKPDFIHTENNALIPTYLAVKKIKKSNRPFVFHTMHLAPVDECSNILVKIIYKHIFHKKGYIPIAITESLSKESKEFYKLDYVPYIENGVDLSRIVDCDKPLEKRPYDVTVIGRFSYQKNHEFLIRTFAEIKKIKPDFKAAFIGGGELFDQMKQLAKESGAEFIEFLGTMPNPGVILKDSKIIALGSRFEANPLSLLEGMAAGCVVVSSDVGGVRNIIKEDNGFLFNLDDDKAFIEIVKNVLNNIQNFNKMSLRNKEYSKQFSMEICVKRYLDLFISDTLK